MNNKKIRAIGALILVVLWLGLTVFAWVKPADKLSLSERRELKQFPVLSGETVLNVGMVDMDTKAGRITVNIRYPISFREWDIYKGIDAACSKYDIGIVKRVNREPLFISADSEFVKTLMQSYRDITGDEDSQPVVIGGGTYAKAVKNIVAFGPVFPGQESVIHQKDEFISIEHLMKNIEIMAHAMYRLSIG
jgi:succinyl-diaminopimelate desuccinylase